MKKKRKTQNKERIEQKKLLITVEIYFKPAQSKKPNRTILEFYSYQFLLIKTRIVLVLV